MNWTPQAGVSALIFDCDGTLADTMPIHYRAWVVMFDRLGIPFPKARFYALGGMPTSRIFRLLADEHDHPIDDVEILRLIADKEALFLEQVHEVKPIPPVLAAAERHRGRLPMAVASGGYRHVVTRTLTAIGAADWFDAVVCAEDTVFHKPEPDVFLEAARRLTVAPERCLVFEDTDLGLEAGRRAGMHTIDIRTWIGS